MFLRYVLAKAEAEAKEQLFKSYIAECAFLTVNNTANREGAHIMTRRYEELLKPPKEEKASEDILNDLVKRGALEVVNGNT